MFQVIKRSDQLNKYFSINAQMPVLQDEELNLGSRQRASVLVSLLSISAAVVLINLITDNFLVRVISLSLIGLVFGNFIPRWNHRFVLEDRRCVDYYYHGDTRSSTRLQWFVVACFFCHDLHRLATVSLYGYDYYG
jgi:hypothetical protein